MKVRNLVIHPEDRSTTFLEPIYKTAENKEVLTKDKSIDEVYELIKTSGRAMMMGHGSPSGLFNVGRFRDARGFVISRECVQLLKDKPENIYIWCNADKFVEPNDLHGFYSGMFISEVGEAKYCGVKANQEMVDESNNAFAEIVGKYIHLPVAELYEKVMEEYGELAKTNPVAKYNHDRLYLR